MKKRLLIIAVVVVVLAVPFSVFAATSDAPAAKSIRGIFGFNTKDLTDKQKADVNSYSQKMADLQKDFVNQMVDNGAITKEQGELEIGRIDDMLAKGLENGYMPGFGMGKGGNRGPGMRDGMGLGMLDFSKLTEQQKADINDSYKKITELSKELVNKLVDNGLLTREQGNASIKSIDEMLAELQANGSAKGLGMFMGGFGAEYKGIDMSKITEQQKAVLTDYSGRLTNLQKELVNKMVSNGALTKEQGDNAINRIDKIDNIQIEKGFSKEFGMKNRMGM
jgi:polyhydroxyalkanoate synthesis regulator phasin